MAMKGSRVANTNCLDAQRSSTAEIFERIICYVNHFADRQLQTIDGFFKRPNAGFPCITPPKVGKNHRFKKLLQIEGFPLAPLNFQISVAYKAKRAFSLQQVKQLFHAGEWVNARFMNPVKFDHFGEPCFDIHCFCGKPMIENIAADPGVEYSHKICMSFFRRQSKFSF